MEAITHPGGVDMAFAEKVQAFAAAELRRGGQRHALATQAFAEVAAGIGLADLAGTAQGRLRWAASATASMLLTLAVTLQPANAADQVTYSEFLAEVQKGDVEMVRVQNDLLSAQYTSKDGSRHTVNLVPNASVEDSLFNTLAEKKVDVVMQNVNANNGGPFDFLARFAGPIAWLIAGLLLLFGGGMGAGGGPAGPMGQNPFQLGRT